MALKKISKAKKTHKPIKSGDVPVTVRHLELVHQSLKSEIVSKTESLRADIKKHDARFASVDARFDLVDARFDKMEARFDKLDSMLLEMKAMIEEQNSRNRYVLDGYTFIYDKHDGLDRRLINVERKVFGMEQS